MSAKRLPIKPTKTAEAVEATVAHPQLVTTTTTETFAGPVPHPDLLAKYEQIVPGAAERIIKMAENEQQVRHESIAADQKNKTKLIEAAQTESAANRDAVKRGQWMGVAISLSCIGAALCCAWLGKSEVIVCGFLAVPTASLIASFFPKSKEKKKEEQKQ